MGYDGITFIDSRSTPGRGREDSQVALSLMLETKGEISIQAAAIGSNSDSKER
jgi:hypothetical protein